jgi:hypothetical protein
MIDDELPKALMNLFASKLLVVQNILRTETYGMSGTFICIGQAVMIATATFYIALVTHLLLQYSTLSRNSTGGLQGSCIAWISRPKARCSSAKVSRLEQLLICP